MANCKDNCIHYKVCMYGDLTEYKTEQILKDDCDDFMPKDVVPKSEVDRLRNHINYLKKYDEERDIALHSRLIAETRKKVAREIIADMRELIKGYENIDIYLDRIEKKYTESEDTE